MRVALRTAAAIPWVACVGMPQGGDTVQLGVGPTTLGAGGTSGTSGTGDPESPGPTGGSESTDPEDDETDDSGAAPEDTADDEPPPVPDEKPDDCLVVLPSDTEIVTGTVWDPVPGKHHWVCTGATLFSDGPDPIVLVEPGATAQVDGPDGRIWVRSRGFAIVPGLGSVIVAEDPNNVDRVVPATTLALCPAIAIDASAVASACP